MPPLSKADFAEVVKRTPLVSMDLVLCDPQGDVLVGYRNNEPAKGWYFVPGGVIRKNERLADAFNRILSAETGLHAPLSKARFLGTYEHLYKTNFAGDPGYGAHYVVLGYDLQLESRPAIRLDDQHSAYRWMKVSALLAAADVHENTKAYFKPSVLRRPAASP